VRYWTGEYYEPSWLLHTRLVVHLGHWGNPCLSVPHTASMSNYMQGAEDSRTNDDAEEVIIKDIGDANDSGGDNDSIDLEPLWLAENSTS
jgi:hypothetical protein